MTIEQIIQHHLVQNQGQKITAHLIYGLVNLISHDARSAGITVDSDKHKEYLDTLTPKENND